MKKIIIFLTILLFTGCNSNYKTYNNYKKELENIKKTTKNIPFNIRIKNDRLSDNIIRYQMELDNVKQDITSVSAIIVHDKKTNDIFPTIGIFDEKINIYKNKKPKGLYLVGYIDSKEEINNKNIEYKVLIKYKINNKSYKVYYVTKK